MYAKQSNTIVNEITCAEHNWQGQNYFIQEQMMFISEENKEWFTVLPTR